MAKKVYLIDNHLSSSGSIIIRNAFHRAISMPPNNLIDDLQGADDIIIQEIDKTGRVIQILKIKGLNATESNIKAVWRVNLESEIMGISSKNTSKTPEIALLVLTQNPNHNTAILHIIFIELKSSLKDSKISGGKREQSTLEQCEEKFNAAMNRLYMLLSLNEHNNNKKYEFSTIIVNFKGGIFYINNSLSKDDGTQLYQTLNHDINPVTFSTLLNDKDKIKILFFANKPSIDISTFL